MSDLRHITQPASTFIHAMKIAELLQSLSDSQDFLAMKRIANRRKDRLDIEALEKILRGENPNE